MLFDTHCHLDPEDDAEALASEARAAGVTRLAIIGTDLEDSLRAGRVAATVAGAVASAGVHPHVAAGFGAMEPFLECLADAAVVALGEIGLDYHYDRSPRPVQRDVFARFFGLAGELGLPAVIHCRDAFADCIGIVRENVAPGQRFVFHSFTGTPAQAEEVLALGGVLSFNGMVTFRRADNIRESLAVVPMGRLLLETDAPYLSPVPFRGKRNVPAYLPYVAGRVAQERNLSVEQVAEATMRNALRFFGLSS